MSKYSMMELAENRNDMYNVLVKYCMMSGAIDQSLYTEYDVKRGLRDSNGKGVLTGLTEISDVSGTQVVDGVKVPADGSLFYQGYSVNDLVKGTEGKRYGFEEITYLLLFGDLPNESQFKSFKAILTDLQELSADFVRDVILHNPSRNIMNSLQKAILSLYSYDDNPEDISVQNVLRQCLQLIGKTPLMSVYAYHGYRHFILNKNLVIRTPKKELSTAENILNMLRPDGKFTPLEAQVLDTALILHAEHGGGNNSTFTTHVVTSTGTDTYSAIAAAIASLKGPRHGGANLKVQRMFSNLKDSISSPSDEDSIKNYLSKVLDKDAFDKSGLIY
jgi:citrate synthase